MKQVKLIDEIKNIRKNIVFFQEKSFLHIPAPVRGTPAGDFIYVCDVAIELATQLELMMIQYQTLLHKTAGGLSDDSNDKRSDSEREPSLGLTKVTEDDRKEIETTAAGGATVSA